MLCCPDSAPGAHPCHREGLREKGRGVEVGAWGQVPCYVQHRLPSSALSCPGRCGSHPPELTCASLKAAAHRAGCFRWEPVVSHPSWTESILVHEVLRLSGTPREGPCQSARPPAPRTEVFTGRGSFRSWANQDGWSPCW